MLENVSDLPSVKALTDSLARHLSVALKMRTGSAVPTPTTAIGLYELPSPVVETTQRLRATLNGFPTLPPYVVFVWQHTTNANQRGCINVSLKDAGFVMRLRRTQTSRVDVVVNSPDTTAIIILLRVYVSPDGTIRGVAPSESHKAFAVVGGRPTSHYSELAALLTEPEDAVPVLDALEAAELWKELAEVKAELAEVKAAREALAELSELKQAVQAAAAVLAKVLS